MKAYIALTALTLAFGSLVGCGGNSQVPDPKTAAEPTEPTLDADEPVEDDKPLESGLIITASPNVEITIDGENKGTTPLDIPVDPGVHSVVWLFEGENQVTMEIELSEGEWKKLNQNVSPDASDAKMGQ